MPTTAQPKFDLGNTVSTSNALDSLNPDDVLDALHRHRHGDWGELDEADKDINEQAVEHGQRIFSRYHDRNRTLFYVVTEHDRSVTTVLLPEDY